MQAAVSSVNAGSKLNPSVEKNALLRSSKTTLASHLEGRGLVRLSIDEHISTRPVPGMSTPFAYPRE
jgi:hypothetical protein